MSGAARTAVLSGSEGWTEAKLIHRLHSDPRTPRAADLLWNRTPRLYAPLDALGARNLLGLIYLQSDDRASFKHPERDPQDERIIRMGRMVELLKAPVHYWTEETMAAADTLPDPPPAEPGVHAWFWDPLPVDHGECENEKCEFRVFLLGVWAFTRADSIAGVIELSMAVHVRPDGVLYQPDFLEHEGRDIEFVRKRLAFLDTSAAVLTQTQGTRQERRALERHGHAPESVSVVTLRRVAEDAATRGSAGQHVDWQHRWWVRGHWRDQPVGPMRSARRLTFVHPHVKGPDDKPLAAKTKLYQVTR